MLRSILYVLRSIRCLSGAFCDPAEHAAEVQRFVGEECQATCPYTNNLGRDPAEHAAEVQRFVGEEQARVEEEVRAQRAEKEGMAAVLRAAQLQIDELTRDVAALTAKAAAAHAEGAACQVSCA